ncbi:MAG: molecular chaperone DnaJ [Actinomycetota bacterium]|nr:molecular chaperone DnaJ [Acidimicrobiia bacterium]MDQ3468620.1 molecular chaperone DnaJ [Actinomycetota bacterium]
MADYYALLGVSRAASTEDLKRAYRRKARELHPDTNPDTTAAEQFKQVARAYQVLSDPDQRARYDRFGEAGVGGAGGGQRMEDMFAGGGLGDIFDAFFGGQGPFGGGGGRRGPAGPPRGQDMEVVADIAFEQAVFGSTIPVTLRLPRRCDDCGGTGAGSGTQPVTCADCGGSGQIQRVRQSLLGQMVTSAPCPRCSGLGQVVVTPCPTCRGEGRVTAEHTYQVDVPAGVDSGSTLRLGGRGAVGPRGGGTGDLYVHLRVAEHERYARDGNDLVTDVPISIAQAALGTTIALPTLDGDEELDVPAGTQPGREFVLRQRGVPRLQGRGRGDLRARLVVEVPTKLDEEEAELLRRLADKRGEPVHPLEKGLFSRIKSAFS